MRQVSDVFRILNHLSISISFISTFVSVAIPQPFRTFYSHTQFMCFFVASVFFFFWQVKAISKLFINFYSKISLKHENFAKDKFLSCCGKKKEPKKNTSKRKKERKI